METAARPLAGALARSWSVPDDVVRQAARSSMTVTEGLPSSTWNGMSAELHRIGSKGGAPRDVHLLAPGLHPASAGEAQLRFAWNDARASLWQRTLAAVQELRDRHGVTHVVGGGSFFSTDHPTPGDVDLLAIGARSGNPETLLEANRAAMRSRSHEFGAFNRAQGEHGVHIYDGAAGIAFPGGPTMLWGFGHAPPHPRPQSFDLRNPGEPLGLVLLNADEMLRTAKI